ncbi:MAG: hypothetical protein V2I33_16230, partial [Kangiellaceae bacterium]|nr:hypothetical protein [Kangiellaceae bacterium]
TARNMSRIVQGATLSTWQRTRVQAIKIALHLRPHHSGPSLNAPLSQFHQLTSRSLMSHAELLLMTAGKRQTFHPV